ncbi:uncharacterized protein LOC144105328 [Amblyomma americanum]
MVALPEPRFNALVFIALVKPYRFLYDNRERDYKDIEMKERRWAIIGKQMGITGKVAAKKFVNLKDRWRRHKISVEASKKPGAEDLPKITWRYYDVLDDMLSKDRQGTSSENIMVHLDASNDNRICHQEPDDDHEIICHQEPDDDHESYVLEDGDDEEPEEVPPEPVNHKRKRARRNSTSSAQNSQRFLETKPEAPSNDDIDKVAGALLDVIKVVAQRERPHRCDMFFNFMAETAKCLSAKEQDLLMRKCHMALYEIQYGEDA